MGTRTSVRDYAELIAGRRLSAAGVLLPIPALEWAELERSLRSRHPELFAIATETRRQWHRRQLTDPTTFSKVRANAFHLERLAELGRLEPELEELRSRIGACQIPSRDPDASPELIDLSVTSRSRSACCRIRSSPI